MVGTNVLPEALLDRASDAFRSIVVNCEDTDGGFAPSARRRLTYVLTSQ